MGFFNDNAIITMFDDLHATVDMSALYHQARASGAAIKVGGHSSTTVGAWGYKANPSYPDQRAAAKKVGIPVGGFWNFNPGYDADSDHNECYQIDELEKIVGPHVPDFWIMLSNNRYFWEGATRKEVTPVNYIKGVDKFITALWNAYKKPVMWFTSAAFLRGVGNNGENADAFFENNAKTRFNVIYYTKAPVVGNADNLILADYTGMVPAPTGSFISEFLTFGNKGDWDGWQIATEVKHPAVLRGGNIPGIPAPFGLIMWNGPEAKFFETIGYAATPRGLPVPTPIPLPNPDPIPNPPLPPDASNLEGLLLALTMETQRTNRLLEAIYNRMIGGYITIPAPDAPQE